MKFFVLISDLNSFLICPNNSLFFGYYCQLLDMVGSLIERTIVHRDFQHKYPILVEWYSQELDDAKSIYDRQLSLAKTPQGTHVYYNNHR